MKKLTKFQETALQKAKEMYIDTNIPMLFDIEEAIIQGKEAKKKIEELNMSNNVVKESARIQWQKDFDSVTINGEDFEQYGYYDSIEVYSDYVGETEYYETLEGMFSDNDYVTMCEKLITKYIMNEE